MTKKEARGGDARWKLGHLPPGTDKKFTELVVPLAKIMAGTLPPWAGLDYNQVQTVVDSVFGDGEIVVTDGDAWCGLVSKFTFLYKLGLRISCMYYRFQLASATGGMDLPLQPLKLSTNSRMSMLTYLTLRRRSKSVLRPILR